MRKILLLVSGIIISFVSVSQDKRNQVTVVTGELMKVVPSLRNLRPDPTFNPRITRDLTGLLNKKTYKNEITDYGTRASGDPVVQKEFAHGPKVPGSSEQPNAGTVITQNYDGMGFTNVAPADPTMTVGPNHVIQMINGSQGSYFRIWNKSGANVITQTYMYQLFTTPGYTGAGDPIVLYDQFADRYVLTEFGYSAGITSFINTLIFAVSITNDPTAGWYIYKFVDNTFFVDYPHYAVWPDAYYGTSNDFNTAANAYLGSSIYAFDKAKMIAGNATATMQKFRLVGTEYATKFRSLAPVNISGNTPPAAGSPGLFLYYHDDNRTATTTDVDSVGMISLQPDFTTPANTVYNFVQSLTVAPFKADICVSRDCVPSGGVGYDAISDRFMNKVYYRNFGTYEAIVGTHTVDANYPALPIKSALRWYEFRRSGPAWSTFQQSTYSPDGDGRFMASININSKGQIALAYNSSGAGKFASIMFTGRNAGDPLNLMVYDEAELKKGDAYGTFANRWGDYNDLVTDPVNDSIFWHTAMYGSTNWKTRVSAFKLETLPLLDARLVGIVAPVSGLAQCNNNIVPIVTIRNAGNSTLTTLNINMQLNSGVVTTIPWTGSLLQTESANVSLPAITAVAGINTLRIFTSDPNGAVDENKLNDTAFTNFTILVPNPSPLIEGFENATFPPAQWRILNPDAGSLTWTRTTAARKSGLASAVIRLYDYSTTNQVDYLLSPIMDVTAADSIIFSFERAYKIYSTSATYADTLEIVLSTDCGATFTSVWKRGGVDLATVPGTVTASYTPAAGDWLNLRMDLKPFIGSATQITVGFKTYNKFGQNIYIDDINMRIFKLPNRDALVKTIVEPGARLCVRTFTPSVQISSLGKDTLKSVKIMYRINNGALDSVQYNGNLLPGGVAPVALKSITLTASGNYTFTAYTKEPNGSNDENTLNDTLRLNFIVLDPQPAPVKESFEQALFPPANWSVSASGSAYAWERTTRAATDQSASAYIKNYRFNSNGKKDDLYSPLVQIAAVDSVYIKFDVAHVTARFPGSTGIPLDTLEVLLTTDCGKTFKSVYKKWGAELQTVGDPNFPYTYPATDTVGFVPTAKSQFRTDFIDISKFVPVNSNFQVVFRNTSSRGNNTYIDNINISTVTLPARLKKNGFMISPNPFDGVFNVQHLLAPANLKGIQVSNAAGQVVFSRVYNGNATNNMRIDLSRYASGVYHIKLLYDNKVITERIIKKK